MRFFRQTLLLVCLGVPCVILAQPVASNDSFSTSEDSPVSYNLVGNDTDPTFTIDPASVDLDILTPELDQSVNNAQGSFAVDATGTVTYTPALDFNGAVTLSYTIRNTNTPADVSAPADIEITVSAVNDRPTISIIAPQSILEDASTTSLPFVVDDVDNTPSALQLNASSSNTAVVDGGILFGGSGQNRTVRVTPIANQSGITTITMEVSDGDLVATSSFQLTITAVNDAPVLTPPANMALDINTPSPATTFTVVDADAGDIIDVAATSSNTALIPTGGIALAQGTGSNWTVTITPANGITGTSTITLTASDGTTTDVATFEVTVTGGNTNPTISAIPNQTIAEDAATASLDFTVGDNESPATSLTVTATSSNILVVPDGSIGLSGTGASRSVVVTPAANGSGTVQVTLTVEDPDGGIASRMFAVNVTPVNDFPTISGISPQSISEDGATAALTFTINDVETDPSSLTLDVSSSNTTIIPNANIVLGGAAQNRTVTVTPAENRFGTATITITVRDEALASSATVFTVNVASVNDAPVLSALTSISVPQNTTSAATPFTVTDVDNAPASITVTAASDNPTLLVAGGIALVRGTGNNWTVQVTPVAGASGTATVTLTASDGTDNSEVGTFTVSVSVPVNTAPTITAIPNQTIVEDAQTVQLPFVIADAETAVTSLSITTSSSNTDLVNAAGIVITGTGANRNVRVRPLPNQSGATTITVNVLDEDGATTSIQFDVVVTPVNDLPTISAIATQVVDPGQTTGPIAFTVGDQETAAATLTVSATTSNAAVVPLSSIVFGGAGASRTVEVTPATPGFSNITVTVEDEEAGTRTTTFRVTANVVNSAPTITAIPNQTIVEDAQTVQLPFVVADAETAVTSLSITTTSSNSDLVNAAGIVVTGTGANRNVRVRPLPNQSGTTTITVNVLDGDGATTSIQFDVVVTPVNDLPTISAIATQVVDPGQSTGPIAFTVGDQETAAATLAVSATTSDAAVVPLSSIVFGGAGASRTVEVTPATSGFSNITLTVEDEETGTRTTTFRVTANVVNSGPTITAIANQAINEDSQTGLISFTIGDTDTPGSSLVVTAFASNTELVDAGGITLGGSGTARTIRIRPIANAFGVTDITVRVSDGSLETEVTFQLTVNAVDDMPTISGIADRTIPENTETGEISFTIGDVETPVASLELTRMSSNLTLVDETGLILSSGNGGARSVNVIPKLNQFGSARITLTVFDGAQRAQTNFLLSVTSVDAPPTITPIADASTPEDTPVDISFTVSDPDSPAENLTVTATSDDALLFPAGNITLTPGVAGAWTLNLAPGGNRNGSANITVTVTDPDAEVTTLTFAVVVTAVNDAPTMNAITAKSTNKNTATAPFNITINDIDTPVGTLTVAGTSVNTTLVPDANIVVTGSTGTRSVVITPAANEFGTSAITLTVSDGAGGTASRTFTLTVNDVNSAPTITAIANQVITEDQVGGTGPLDFTVGDPDGTIPTVTASADDAGLIPASGITLGGSGASRTITVIPAANQSGTANITVTVNDGTLSASTSFTVQVTAVNDLPTITSVGDQTIEEGASTGALSFTIGDIETPAASLTVSRTSTNTDLIPVANVVLGGSGASRTVTVTPVAGVDGASTITLTVSDGTASASTSFIVTVTSVDDPPTISAIVDQTTLEDTPTGAITFTVNDPETPAASLTVTGSSSNTSLVSNGNIVFGGSGASRTVTLTPGANQNGTTTITISVSDGAHSVSTTFALTVTPVDDPPTISAIANQTISEDSPTGDIAFTIADPDGSPGALVVTATSDNQTIVPDANIALGGTTGTRTIRVTPAADRSGVANITVVVSDGVLTASRTFSVTVEDINDPPTITAIADQTTLEDTGTGPIAFTIGDAETPVGSLTVTRSSSNTTLIPVANIVLGGSGASRTLAITPANNRFGEADISVTVDDGTTTTTITFKITVTPVDDPPSIGAIANRTISEDTDTGDITFSVSDPETPAASIIVTATSSNTTLVPPAGIVLGGTTGTRTIRITPAQDQFGTTTITITASDGTNSTTRNFDLIVTPVNDLPTITGQIPLTIDENQILTLELSQLTIVDPDNTPAQLTLYVTGGANYTITGANAIRPVTGFHGVLSVPVFVSDPTANGPIFNVAVTVNSSNDAPVITAQSPLVTNEDQAITLQPNNFTITDADGDTNFTLTILAGSNYTFSGTTVTPALNYNGTLFVNVVANDGQANSAPFAAQITVTPVNDPPTVTGQATLTTTEDTPITLVIGNFIVTDPEPTSYTLTVQPAASGANYTVSGNTVTPNLNYNGILTVAITVSDGFANSEVFQAAVTVTPVNDPPTITASKSLSTVEDIPITLQLSDLFVDDVDNTYPTGFSMLVLPGTNYTYSGTTITPTLDFFGTLNVNVQVYDGAAYSATFQVVINVTDDADAPTITGQKTVSMNEDESRVIVLEDITYEDADTPPSQIILSLLPGTNYSFSGTTLTPNANYFGTLSVGVRIFDGEAYSNTYQLQVTVNNVNDEPTANNIPDLNIVEDAGLQTVTITGISAGPGEVGPLQILSTSDNTNLIKVITDSPAYNGSAPTHTITFTPEPDAFGTATISVRIIDGEYSLTKTLVVNVAPINDAPTMTAIANMTILEDAAETIFTLTGITPGGGPAEGDQKLSFIVSSSSPLFEVLTVGAQSGTTAPLRVKPSANAFGPATITVRVQDDGAAAPPPNVNFLTRTFTLNITPVNDLPVVKTAPPLTAEPGVPYLYQLEATDDDGDNITITANLPSWLTLTIVSNGVATITGTPPSGTSGDFILEINVTDPTGPVQQAGYTLAVNSRPSVVNVSATTQEDVPYTFKATDFTGGFTDPDGNTLAFIQIVGLPAHGSLSRGGVTLAAGDELSYDDLSQLQFNPTADYFGSDAFQWNGADGFRLYSAVVANMTLTITPVNDAPRITEMELETDTLKYELGSERAVQLTERFNAVEVDGDPITAATLTFRTVDGFQFRELNDLLGYAANGKFTAEWRAAAGTLTIRGVASVEEYVAVIRAVTYSYLNANDLLLDTRSVAITLSDATSTSQARSRTVTLIYTFEDLSIPNAFSPNADNVNETWRISGTNLPIYDEAQIRVYRGDGTLLYQATGFDSPWTGVYNGTLLPSGTYFYTIDLKYNRVRYKGTVTLLR